MNVKCLRNYTKCKIILRDVNFNYIGEIIGDNYPEYYGYFLVKEISTENDYIVAKVKTNISGIFSNWNGYHYVTRLDAEKVYITDYMGRKKALKYYTNNYGSFFNFQGKRVYFNEIIFS